MAIAHDPDASPDRKPTLPIDRSVPFHRSLYPRDPNAYEPLDHFYQRQKDPERYLLKSCDGMSAVRRTIEEGALRDNEDGCGCFVYGFHGVEYYVIVGFHHEGHRIAVTGWPLLRDETQALDSGAWRRDELDTIEAFNREHFNQHA